VLIDGLRGRFKSYRDYFFPVGKKTLQILLHFAGSSFSFWTQEADLHDTRICTELYLVALHRLAVEHLANRVPIPFLDYVD
jgi:hypothetical protein